MQNPCVSGNYSITIFDLSYCQKFNSLAKNLKKGTLDMACPTIGLLLSYPLRASFINKQMTEFMDPVLKDNFSLNAMLSAVITYCILFYSTKNYSWNPIVELSQKAMDLQYSSQIVKTDTVSLEFSGQIMTFTLTTVFRPEMCLLPPQG